MTSASGAARTGPTVPRRAREPEPSRFRFPQGAEEIARLAGDADVVGVGADLRPGTLLAAYRSGVFPMPARRGVMAWWSPDPRGIIPLDGLRTTRSLRQSLKRYEVRIDAAVEEVIDACADRARPGAWIDRDIKRAYLRLYELGWVHTVEAWDDAGRLAGGLYGVAIGGLFAGESMFHRRTDASKVALVELGRRLRAAGDPDRRLLDVQWATDHLRSLGAVDVSRARYHELLANALPLAQPPGFGGG